MHSFILSCLSHENHFAKLHAYGFSLNAQKVMNSYLNQRKQRVKINYSYSSWEEILFRVPQISILGSSPFSIFLCDIFFLIRETVFASYVDDKIAETLDDVIETLKDSTILFQWFLDNQFRANIGKCFWMYPNCYWKN